MKKIISTFLLIILTTNIGFAQIKTLSNNEQHNINKEEIQNLITIYQEDINKIIKKEKREMTSREFFNFLNKAGCTNWDNHLEDSIKKNEFNPNIIPLNDGDYVYWNGGNEYFLNKDKKRKKI